MPIVAIALGSNIGPRRNHINSAKQALAQLPNTTLLAFSSIIETPPFGPIKQPPFLNAAAILETTLTPTTLLDHLESIENQAGRPPVDTRQKWGPRTLDLDILLYDDQIIDIPRLKIPHPHMQDRLFVLQPLAEITPDTIHPTTQKTISQLLQTLGGACD